MSCGWGERTFFLQLFLCGFSKDHPSSSTNSRTSQQPWWCLFQKCQCETFYPVPHYLFPGALRGTPGVSPRCVTSCLHHDPKCFVFSGNVFASLLVIIQLLIFPQKVPSKSLSCEPDILSIAVQTLLRNFASLNSSWICGPINIPSLSFARLICGDLRQRYWNLWPSLSRPLGIYFIRPSLMWSGWLQDSIHLDRSWGELFSPKPIFSTVGVRVWLRGLVGIEKLRIINNLHDVPRDGLSLLDHYTHTTKTNQANSKRF